LLTSDVNVKLIVAEAALQGLKVVLSRLRAASALDLSYIESAFPEATTAIARQRAEARNERTIQRGSIMPVIPRPGTSSSMSVRSSRSSAGTYYTARVSWTSATGSISDGASNLGTINQPTVTK
jgi:hypothetical protein